METIGSLIDKITIVNLKIWKLEDIKVDSQNEHEVMIATKKASLLNQQRNDLMQEIDELILCLIDGTVVIKNYKQGDMKSYGTGARQ